MQPAEQSGGRSHSPGTSPERESKAASLNIVMCVCLKFFLSVPPTGEREGESEPAEDEMCAPA